jgi:glycogen operon protein
MPGFGATYSTDHSSVTFELWSPRATRVELWIYATAIGVDASLKRTMNSQGDGIWSVTASVASLNAAGIGATIYYGYRAWGPNWPFDAAWTPGS